MTGDWIDEVDRHVFDDSMEDRIIRHVDLYRDLRKLVPRLSVAEKWVLLQLASGYPVSRHDKDTLTRLRKKVAATKSLQKSLYS